MGVRQGPVEGVVERPPPPSTSSPAARVVASAGRRIRDAERRRPPPRTRRRRPPRGTDGGAPDRGGHGAGRLAPQPLGLRPLPHPRPRRGTRVRRGRGDPARRRHARGPRGLVARPHCRRRTPGRHRLRGTAGGGGHHRLGRVGRGPSGRADGAGAAPRHGARRGPARGARASLRRRRRRRRHHRPARRLPHGDDRARGPDVRGPRGAAARRPVGRVLLHLAARGPHRRGPSPAGAQHERRPLRACRGAAALLRPGRLRPAAPGPGRGARRRPSPRTPLRRELDVADPGRPGDRRPRGRHGPLLRRRRHERLVRA